MYFIKVLRRSRGVCSVTTLLKSSDMNLLCATPEYDGSVRVEKVALQGLDNALGWVLGKKCLPIDSGIMGVYADIYRRLLGQKNPGSYFIKFWAQGIFVLLYCNYYNDSMVAT